MANEVDRRSLVSCKCIGHPILKDLSFKDMRMLSVITGKNGSGKTQLLSLLKLKLEEKLKKENSHNIDRRYEFCFETPDNKTTDIFPISLTFNADGSTSSHPLIGQQCFENDERELKSSLFNYNINRNNKGKYAFKVYTDESMEKINNLSKEYNDKTDYAIKLRLGMSPSTLRHTAYMIWYLINIQKVHLEEINEHLRNNEFEHVISSESSCLKTESSLSLDFKKIKIDNVPHTYSELSSGEYFYLSVLMWDFVSQRECKIYSEAKFLFLLDEPDSHLHQSRINKVMRIIKESLVERLKCQVILTTHNDRTVDFLDDGSENVGCYIMSKSQENVEINRWEFLASKMLTDNKYMNICKDKVASIPQFEEWIEHSFKAGIINDYGRPIERLFCLYFECDKAKSFNLFKQKSSYLSENPGAKIHLEFVPKLDDCDLIETYSTIIENHDFLILWPKDMLNPCFDFLTISKIDKLIHFYQISVNEDIAKKLQITMQGDIKADIDAKFIKFYHKCLNNLGDFKWAIMLIHGNTNGSYDNKVYRYCDKYDVQCYSVNYVGENFFQSKFMTNLKKNKIIKAKFKRNSKSNVDASCGTDISPKKIKRKSVEYDENVLMDAGQARD